MYKSSDKKGPRCYCPVCCQFGRPASCLPVEGKTKSGENIMLCTSCGKVDDKRPHKDLPGQKVLDFRS